MSENPDIEGFKFILKKDGKPHLKCRAIKCAWKHPLLSETPLEVIIARVIEHRRFCAKTVISIEAVELNTNFRIERKLT